MPNTHIYIFFVFTLFCGNIILIFTLFIRFLLIIAQHLFQFFQYHFGFKTYFFLIFTDRSTLVSISFQFSHYFPDFSQSLNTCIHIMLVFMLVLLIVPTFVSILFCFSDFNRSLNTCINIISVFRFFSIAEHLYQYQFSLHMIF